VVDGSGLENRRTRKGTGGSNPSLSATQSGLQRNLAAVHRNPRKMPAKSRFSVIEPHCRERTVKQDMGIKLAFSLVGNWQSGFLARESASLFDETINQPLGSSLRSEFLSQVASLSVPSTTPNAIDFISIETASQYDDGESQETPPPTPAPMDYLAAFANSPTFKNLIQGKIPSGSTLTPVDVVTRAQTQSCAGCHHISVGAQLGGGLGTWPSTLPPTFAHDQLAPPLDSISDPASPRYQISDALRIVFLPFRKHVIETFLQ
jgi:hypothetical protein